MRIYRAADVTGAACGAPASTRRPRTGPTRCTRRTGGCAARSGPTNDDQRAVAAYRKVLEWDIMKAPKATRWTERALNPVLGKSLVVYARKPHRDRSSAAARGRRRPHRRGGGGERREHRRPAAALRDDPVVPGRPLRPVEPRGDGDGAVDRRPPRRGRAGLRVVGADATTGRQLVQLLRRGRRWHRRQPRHRGGGRQARHQRVRLRRDRGVAPLADHAGPGLRRAPVADGPPGHRLGALAADRAGRDRVGPRGRRHARGRTRCSPAPRPSTTRSTARVRLAELVGRRPAPLGPGPRRARAGHPHRPARLRAQGALGHGLVLPGPVQRARRRRGRAAAGRARGTPS